MEIIDDIAIDRKESPKELNASFWYFLNNWKYSWIFTWSSAVVGLLAAFVINNMLPAMIIAYITIALFYVIEYIEWVESTKLRKKHKPVFIKIFNGCMNFIKHLLSL